MQIHIYTQIYIYAYKFKSNRNWGSHCGIVGSTLSLQWLRNCWDPGSISNPSEWVRIWHCRSCGVGSNCDSDSIPGPESSICLGAVKKKKKSNTNCFKFQSVPQLLWVAANTNSWIPLWLTTGTWREAKHTFYILENTFHTGIYCAHTISEEVYLFFLTKIFLPLESSCSQSNVHLQDWQDMTPKTSHMCPTFQGLRTTKVSLQNPWSTSLPTQACPKHLGTWVRKTNEGSHIMCLNNSKI